MKPKGSKYARKHYIEHEQEKVVSYPLEFADFFENYYNFEKRFLKLSYDEQINLIACLYDFASTGDKNYGELSSFYLGKIHELTDSDYEEGIYEPVAVDEKRLIRMDCHGSISRRRPDQLSELYKYFKNQPKKKKFLLREYNIENSPAWKVMAQFESFRKIAPKIKRSLYKSQINPDALNVMNINDYCDVIYNTFSKGGEKAHFIETKDSIKHHYVRQFMKECGDTFYRMLIERGIDKRAVKSLCNRMYRFGSCDLESLVVTETHYTARILKDLKKNGFNVRGIEAGMPIADDFVNYLIDADREDLLLARNPDGSPVDKYVLPRLELHHNKAVQFADSEYLASANYPDKLVLLESKIHRQYYHLFDSIIKQNEMQNYFSRLNISSRYTRMRLGFAHDDALFGDFENTTAFRKRAEEDKKHRVNYFEMQDQYLANVLSVIDKYKLNFNKFGSKYYQNLVQKLRPTRKNKSTPVNMSVKNNTRK